MQLKDLWKLLYTKQKIIGIKVIQDKLGEDLWKFYPLMLFRVVITSGMFRKRLLQTFKLLRVNQMERGDVILFGKDDVKLDEDRINMH